MIYIQCTKKLLEELKISVEKVDVTHADPLYCWHANIFVHNKKKCVLVMNNHTRYNFLLYGLKSNNFKNFTNLVIQGIKQNLLADEFDASAVDEYLLRCKESAITTTSERSIISQIKEMVHFCEFFLDDFKEQNEIPDLVKINRNLNTYVMSKLPQIYSVKAMKEVFNKGLSDREFEANKSELKPRKYYQVKITLEHVQPSIYRRLLIPDNIPFTKFHKIIQTAFGWGNQHLYLFDLPDYIIKEKDPYFTFDKEEKHPVSVRIDDFMKVKCSFMYEYDFGDSWRHIIKVEKEVFVEEDPGYPYCLEGERNCPPEDIGGPGGYEYFVSIRNNPENEEYVHMMRWAEEVTGQSNFDPEYFNLKKINRRLKKIKC
ncbi:plasmid pRiA4b ORF-3 family protein [Fictibacillus nanhaiensis]|uniref:plasmid pRiA4b ORF-3 family protein n=1 Tax=Fictibacillus nanhaiensis TaxID=742169 RepID=UPI002040988A|nr:plasmid pRiA4b ORF-3 family protein [Fictibacillus nanhaiensis]MCM3733141.1 plasmid pRiA4b ORF-3 family protein [Fictibacillus nanhaiensis]